jgi:hypothetical protein
VIVAALVCSVCNAAAVFVLWRKFTREDNKGYAKRIVVTNASKKWVGCHRRGFNVHDVRNVSDRIVHVDWSKPQVRQVIALIF